MAENRKNSEEFEDISESVEHYESEEFVISLLESIIKTTSDYTYIEKRKMLKEIPNVRRVKVSEFVKIFMRANANHGYEIHKSFKYYIHGKDLEGNPVKVSTDGIFDFLWYIENVYRDEPIQDEPINDTIDPFEAFVKNVLAVIEQNRNLESDYYNYFRGRDEIWEAMMLSDDNDISKSVMVKLYVQSRLTKINKKLDTELPFLNFDVLLKKYNERILERAEKFPNKDQFIEEYGVDAIIEEGNKIIKDKLINDTLFSCVDSDKRGCTSFAHNLDLYRATEFMSISEIVSIFNENMDRYNIYEKFDDETREEIKAKYGMTIREEKEIIEQKENFFNEFKKNRLPIIVDVLKNRLINEGLVNKDIDQRLLKAKICSELLNMDSIYGDSSKIDDIGLKSIVSQKGYLVKKVKFERISPFGILRMRQKQNQLGVPDYAKLF